MLSTFIDFQPGDITSMFSYTTGFFNDMKPFIIPVIAVSLGLLVITVLVRLFSK